MVSVYTVLNTFNGKMYVGVSSNPKRRWAGHKYESRRGAHRLLCNAIRKHGVDVFQFTVLQSFDTRVLAEQAEKYWISYFQSENRRHGYNQTAGGDGGWDNDAVRKGWWRALATRKQRSVLLLQDAVKNGVEGTFELCQLPLTRSKRMWSCNRGSSNPHAKLTEDAVRMIRILATKGVMYEHLAEHFDVKWNTIKGIVRGEQWRHVQ